MQFGLRRSGGGGFQARHQFSLIGDNLLIPKHRPVEVDVDGHHFGRDRGYKAALRKACPDATEWVCTGMVMISMIRNTSMTSIKAAWY